MKFHIQRTIYISVIFIVLISFIPQTTSTSLEDESIYLNSESAILIDATTGQVLYEKNSNRSMYPASITKIVTAIVAIEQGKLDDIVTVSENARYVDGTRVYLEIGEKVPLLKLVNGLLINSGNDAGVAIAEHMAGTIHDFSEVMNQFVQEEIGVLNTVFRNPHGLFHPEHVTTAYDMAKITQYAMKNDIFREIVGTKHLEWKGESWDTVLYNHHQMVRQRDDVIGVKNGFVDQSGFTLVTAAENDDIELIVVALKADSANMAYNDTEKLLEYGFNNYKTNIISIASQEKMDVDQKYDINQDLYFTTERDVEWTMKINENGELIVEDHEGKILFIHTLTPLDRELISNEPIMTEGTAHIEGENSVLNYVVVFSLSVIGLIVIGISGLFIRKYVRKKRRFFS